METILNLFSYNFSFHSLNIHSHSSLNQNFLVQFELVRTQYTQGESLTINYLQNITVFQIPVASSQKRIMHGLVSRVVRTRCKQFNDQCNLLQRLHPGILHNSVCICVCAYEWVLQVLVKGPQSETNGHVSAHLCVCVCVFSSTHVLKFIYTHSHA